MDPKKAWHPNSDTIENANITEFFKELKLKDVKQFHAWSTKHYPEFWQQVITKLAIVFKRKPDTICDLSAGVESPYWFKGAKLNIIDSCFNADDAAVAIIYLDEERKLQTISFGALKSLSNQIANGLVAQGCQASDVIGLIMPMNVYAVAIYLGIIKMGGVVATIPDSFSPEEMSVRLRISKANVVFTQDVTSWGGKKLPLYEKVSQLGVKTIIVTNDNSLPKKNKDLLWSEFISKKKEFDSFPLDPMAPSHIMFSSGTTAEPKAIVWNHTTPIKSASDAFFHQDIKQGDILAWPTNLGWMMGPWLIYASFINRASIALYTEAPKDRAFGEFIQQAKVTMLGLVPTLVASWRQSKCMEMLDWSTIKKFSSSGECSNPDDMWYLMNLAGLKPVIEYCGGTEIGGAYISSTMVETNYPSLFSTPTMGLNFAIIDENGKPANIGEVAIVPPSIGLSTVLLNADHHKIYFTNMPKTAEGITLRRHGDQIKRLKNGYYSVLGRVDDTMKLGGIKISAAEIERALVGIPGILETAAIAIAPPNSGPSQLVIFAATHNNLEKESIKKEMQQHINHHLNPLFRIHDVVFCKELPKTASNKIMRRVLRQSYTL